MIQFDQTCVAFNIATFENKHPVYQSTTLFIWVQMSSRFSIDNFSHVAAYDPLIILVSYSSHENSPGQS